MIAAATTAATAAATAAAAAGVAAAAPVLAFSAAAAPFTMVVAGAAGARTWPWLGEYAGRDGQIREQIRDLCEVDAPIETIQPFLYSYLASTAPNAHCLPIVCSKQVHKNYEEIVGRMPYKKRLIDKVRRKSKCNR